LYLLPEKYQFEIDIINTTHKGNVTECRFALIRTYLKVGEVSWNKVIDALEKSVNDNIAKDIKKLSLTFSKMNVSIHTFFASFSPFYKRVEKKEKNKA